jgi:hypothetical protein
MSATITTVNSSLSTVSFEVKNITTAETLLMSLDKMNDKSTKSVAYILRQVYDKKLLDENQNIAEWAQEKFGYKKAMVYQLIKVNTELMSGNKSIFCVDDKDFSITQLLRMVSRKANKKKHTKAFTADDLAILLTNGSITMETSSAEIKDIIDKYCMETVEGVAEEVTDETEKNEQTRELVTCYVNGTPQDFEKINTSDCIKSEPVKVHEFEYEMYFNLNTKENITVIFRVK